MKIIPAALLALTACVGCKSPVLPAPQPERTTRNQDYRERPTPTEDNGYRNDDRGLNPSTDQPSRSSRRRANRARPETNATPGVFDFYLLNLSWSPEFCATHAQSPECAAHPGFVVHGLWPQNNDGTYPENCGQSNFPNTGLLIDIIPTASLIQHEWQTHGTCTGLSPADFSTAVHHAYAEVHIPPSIAQITTETMLTPNAILAQFAAANPSFPQGSIALSCGNNRLTAVEVCLSKSLTPEACSGVRSCNANAVKITPR